MKNDKPTDNTLDMLDNSGLEGKYLTFYTDGQQFGVPIADVLQIIGMQEITGMPEYPGYAKGVINLRGQIIPVIDMRLRLGKPQADYNERTCIIVANIKGQGFGFIVDEVHEVADIPRELVSLPPQMSRDLTNRYLTGIGRTEGQEERLVLLLDTAKILREEEFAALADAVGA